MLYEFIMFGRSKMILDRFRRKKKKEAPPIARSDFLRIIPVRNPSVKSEKDENNKITLILQIEPPKEKKDEEKDTKRRRRRRGILKPSTPQVKQRKIHLDTMGSIVWELCDGRKTVKNIADQLHERYKMLPSEAEISLNTYFNELAKRGLVAFMIPEEVASKLGAKEIKEEKKQPS
jgi:hypothetical protein